jgi:hypothetical protein
VTQGDSRGDHETHDRLTRSARSSPGWPRRDTGGRVTCWSGWSSAPGMT